MASQISPKTESLQLLTVRDEKELSSSIVVMCNVLAH